MNLNAANLGTDSPSQMRFCALEYWPQNWEIATSTVAPVILLVLRDEKGRLHIRIHPELHVLVHSEDLAFLESLLQDFTERAKLHPEELFKHLCSLGVGPLVTQQVGSNLLDHPLLQECSLKFEELN